MENKDMTSALIHRILYNDRSAMEQFVSDYTRLVYASIASILPLQEREDAVMDFFLRVWSDDCHMLRAWRGESKLSTYLYRAATRFAINYSKRNAVRQRHEVSIHSDACVRNLEDPTGGFEIEDDDISRRTALHRAMRLISLRDQDILRLRYCEQLSYLEIGARMNLSRAAVGMALARAERHLRQKIDHLLADTALYNQRICKV